MAKNKLLDALNYAEVYELPSTSFVDYQNFLNLLNPEKHTCWDETLLQPFESHLILKYFNGWDFKDGEVPKFVFKEWAVNFTLRHKKMILWNEKTFDEFTFIHPRNLDDFINDVKRAGVELKLKKLE